MIVGVAVGKGVCIGNGIGVGKGVVVGGALGVKVGVGTGVGVAVGAGDFGLCLRHRHDILGLSCPERSASSAQPSFARGFNKERRH